MEIVSGGCFAGAKCRPRGFQPRFVPKGVGEISSLKKLTNPVVLFIIKSKKIKNQPRFPTPSF